MLRWVYLRTGLRWFLFKHLNAKKIDATHAGFGGGRDLPTGEVKVESSDRKLLIGERVQFFMGLLSKCDG